MNLKKSLLRPAGAGAAMLLLIGAASAQVIPNPSFEADVFTTSPGYISGNKPITGWTGHPTDRVGLNPAAGMPFANNGVVPNGTNVAFIQSATTGPSSLRTTITELAAGTKYTVNFRLNGRNGQTPFVKIGINDQPVLNFSTTSVGGTAAYRFAAFDFTAAGSEAVLSLTNDVSGDTAVLIDDFTINVSTSGWSYAAWQNDATSGVDSSSVYTHAYNFGGGTAPDTTVNGVLFRGATGNTPVIANEFSIAGFNNNTADSGNALISAGGGSAVLGARMIYGGNPGTYYIGNLVPGMEYEATFYCVGWENGMRALTFSSGTDRMTINEDHFGNDQGIRISYRYIAPPSGAITLLSTPTLPANTLHLYGFSNREFNQQLQPTVGIQPRSQVTTPGSTVGFGITAGGQKLLSFQWLKDGSELGGQTNRFLTLSNVAAGDVAGYSVIVSNANGAVTSQVATLTFGSIANPSFEADFFHTFPGYVSNNRIISGWTGSLNSRFGLNPHGDDAPFANNGIVPDGRQVAFIQGSGTNWLGTQLNGLTPGEKYTLTFRINARNGQTATMRAAIDNQLALEFRANSVGGTNAYRYVSLDFTPTTASPFFALTNETSADQTVLIDDFRIAPYAPSKWIVAQWSDDATSGVDPSKFYTHAFNFGVAPPNTTINGVPFTGLAGANPAVPGRFQSAGFASTFPGPDVNSLTLVGGGSADLAYQFIYGGPLQTFTLTNLVPGMEYVATIYSVGWEAKGYGRTAMFYVGNDRLMVNQDEYGDNNGLRVSYRYTADTNGAVVIGFQPTDGGSTIHTYAFANYAVTDSQPIIALEPQGKFVPQGDTVSLSIGLSAGSQPTYYRWQKDGVDITDATNATLVLSNLVSLGTSGYRVIITNSFGSATSLVAVVEVGTRIGELFGTGVNNAGALLGDNVVDPHYRALFSSDPAAQGPTAFTMIDNQFPIVPGTYITNGPLSRWITATTNAPAGTYIYRTAFVIDSTDPAQSQVSGRWASDNEGLEIRLNGVSIGASNMAVRPFAEWATFTITNGFVAGSNTLDFVITNLPPTGFTAFRAELTGVGRPLAPKAPVFVSHPQNQLVQEGSIATLAAVVSGSPDLMYQWMYYGFPIPDATNRILQLPSATQFDHQGEYTVVVTNPEGEKTSDVAILTINVQPVANADSIASGVSSPVSIPEGKLLFNDGDAEADTLSLLAVSSSTNGGTVTLASGAVTYTPVAGFTGTDRFTYTLGDSRGGRSTGSVVVTVGATNFLSIVNPPLLKQDGHFEVGFQGVPGYPYTIERSTSVLGPWEVLQTIVADSNGLILVDDPNSPPAPARFYRTTYP